MPQRPKSIVQFELFYWVWVSLSLAGVAVDWPGTSEDPNMQKVMASMAWFPYAVMLIVVALLAWLGIAIARRGSNIGRSILAAIAVLSVGLIAKNLLDGIIPGSTLSSGIGAAACVAVVLASVLLFRADARPWFSEDDVEPVA